MLKTIASMLYPGIAFSFPALYSAPTARPIPAQGNAPGHHTICIERAEGPTYNPAHSAAALTLATAPIP